MSWLWITLGTILVVVGLLDVFFTVLNYDGFGFLSSRLYRLMWNLVRVTTTPFPSWVRDFARSTGGPLMIPATLLLWMGLEILGFGLIYYANITQDFSFTTGTPQTFWQAVYLSGVTMTTLGFGDITPVSTLYGVLAFMQAMIGFSILTLAISYVLNIYQVLQQWNTMASGLYHQATDTADPVKILAHHFSGGEPRELGSTLGGLHQNLVSYYEGVRCYPIVYYFHNREVQRSLPYVFRMAGGTAATLRWGLPEGHPATREPELPTLLVGIDDIMSRMEERFLSAESGKAAPETIRMETFAVALEEGRHEDPWLSGFLDTERKMREQAGLEDPPDPAEAYARYKEWLSFAHRTDAFVRAVARDLGYDPDHLSRGDLRDEPK